MDLFRNGTDKTGTGQVPFTRRILSEPFVFLSEPLQFFRSCKRPFSLYGTWRCSVSSQSFCIWRRILTLLDLLVWRITDKVRFHSYVSFYFVSFLLLWYFSFRTVMLGRARLSYVLYLVSYGVTPVNKTLRSERLLI